MTILALLFVSPAYAQEERRECTKEYVAELAEHALDHKETRIKWDKMRPYCKIVEGTENITGKILTPLGGKWLWDNTIGENIDPKVLSRTCKFLRKTGKEITSPEDMEKHVADEIERCRHAQ